MTELQQILGLVTLGVTGLGAFARWTVKLWAEIRREAIAQQREEAAQRRADNERMLAAYVEQARSGAALASSNAVLAGTINELRDDLRDMRAVLGHGIDDARIPRRAHNGSRSPRGEHDDD